MATRKLIPQNFQMTSGNDKDLNIHVRDGITGQDTNLTGASIIWALSRTPFTRQLVRLEAPTQITITDAEAGRFTVELADTDTEGLPGGTFDEPVMYYHEARIQSAAGRKITVVRGYVEMLENTIDDL